MNLYSALVAGTVSADDVVKLLLLLLVAAVLLGLGRWSSRLGGGTYEEAEAEVRISNSPPLKDEDVAPRVSAPSAEEIAASFPFDPLLGKIRLKKFFFEKVDAIPGPADLNVFADELHVQLYDPDSGHWWWQSYFVATPQGLAQILRDKSWKYLHAPEILVLPRYDLEEIRRAVVSRIMADHEYFKDKQQPEEESL
jgi:hypothetical protein